MKAPVCVLIIPDKIGSAHGYPRCDYFESEEQCARYFRCDDFENVESHLNEDVYVNHRVEVITEAEDRQNLINEFKDNFWVRLHLDRWEIG